MKIEFKKISFQKKPFTLTHNEAGLVLTFQGEFWKESATLVTMSATLNGLLMVTCDLSGEDYPFEINEELKLKVSDGPFRGFDKDYDVIESLDGTVDFDDILVMEIEAIRSDYHTKTDNS